MQNPSCNFCGKAQEHVKKLISSPTCDCYICDTCVEICENILNHKSSPKHSPQLSLPSPLEIKKMLDDYIVGQNEAKKTISVAVYNHYKRLNYNLTPKKNKVELEKSNILLIGPTGVGKTLIAKSLARLLNVPFVCADATTLTEAGYVGEDVDSILSKLIDNANGDIAKAEMGIVYLDEVDKIAKKVDMRNFTRDVSGEGVQQALLKILEGTVVNINPSLRKINKNSEISIDTSNILFICGGAFVGLDKIMKSRQQVGIVGFDDHLHSILPPSPSVEPIDLIEFGLIPEFVGRLPIVINLNPLDKKSLLNILTKPKNNLVEQYKTIFNLDDVTLVFEPKALKLIAEKALKLNLGARGLRTVMEEVLLDTMFHLSKKDKNTTILIDENCIKNKTYPRLKKRLNQ